MNQTPKDLLPALLEAAPALRSRVERLDALAARLDAGDLDHDQQARWAALTWREARRPRHPSVPDHLEMQRLLLALCYEPAVNLDRDGTPTGSLSPLDELLAVPWVVGSFTQPPAERAAFSAEQLLRQYAAGPDVMTEADHAIREVIEKLTAIDVEQSAHA